MPPRGLFSSSALLTVLLALFLLTGCGGKDIPPPKEAIELDLTFTADPDINPSLRGRPSPLAVRVFELKATDSFEDADYFTLQTDPQKTLGDALLPGGDKFVIRPGGREIIRRKAHPSTTALAIIAGYRDIPRATWQAIHLVPPPPDVSLFSSPLKIVLEIQLHELEMRLVPQK